MKSLLATLAASVSLIGGVQVLAPVPAVAMDGQDETSPCTEDWYYDDVGEDCSGEGRSGGGGTSDGGGSSGGGDDHYYDETGDPCADYGECWDEEEDIGRDDPLYDETPDPCPESVECWDDQRQEELERKRVEEGKQELEELDRDFAEDPRRVTEELMRRIETEREVITDALREIASRCQWWSLQGNSGDDEARDTEHFRCWREREAIAGIARAEINRLDRETGSVKEAFAGGRKPKPVFRKSGKVGDRSNGASIHPLPLAPANGPGKKHGKRGRRGPRPT